MSANGTALDRCLQQLVVIGKRYGGFLTYQVLINVLGNEQCNASPEALDWILDRLATEGFQLVKQLPTDPAEDFCPQGRRSPDGRDRQRIGVDRDPQPTETARSEQTASLPDPDRGDSDLWAEQAMDELLSRAKAGVLHREDLLRIIETYRLSPFEVEELCDCLEVEELCDCLRLRGIEPPEFDLYEIYQGSVESLDRIKPALCSEEAVDKLLFRAEIGLLSGEDILTVIETCCLSECEVYQLLEYLYSKGVDLPAGYPPWQAKNLLEDSRYDGEKKFPYDPYIETFVQRAKRWNGLY